MTDKGAKKQQPLRPGKGHGPATDAPSERRKKSTKKQSPAALPKEHKGTGGKRGGGLH